MCYGKCSSVGCGNEAVFCDRDNRVFCEVCYHADENDDVLDVMFSDDDYVESDDCDGYDGKYLSMLVELYPEFDE